MNNQEAIDLLDNLIGMISDNQDSDYDEALKLGIKALSREADYFENEIADLQNRLDIAEYDKERYKEEITTLEAKNDVLDKIRAEILILDDADYDFEGYYKAVTDALHIIDKYKAESEESE